MKGEAIKAVFRASNKDEEAKCLASDGLARRINHLGYLGITPEWVRTEMAEIAAGGFPTPCGPGFLLGYWGREGMPDDEWHVYVAGYPPKEE